MSHHVPPIALHGGDMMGHDGTSWPRCHKQKKFWHTAKCSSLKGHRTIKTTRSLQDDQRSVIVARNLHLFLLHSESIPPWVTQLKPQRDSKPVPVVLTVHVRRGKNNKTIVTGWNIGTTATKHKNMRERTLFVDLRNELPPTMFMPCSVQGQCDQLNWS